MPPVISSSEPAQAAGAIRRLSTTERVRAALELLRPANSITAVADVLAGWAVAWHVSPGLPLPAAPLLAASGALLYAGGVCLNDACDSESDGRWRPERPIPSGRISRAAAFAIATALLLAGVALAFAFSLVAGLVATATLAAILAYDLAAKHSAAAGPIAMGLCRAGSLLLGVSASGDALARWWWIGALPVAYVGAITLVSRGESDGRNPAGRLALALVVSVTAGIGVLAWIQGRPSALPFLALFAALVWPAFWRALAAPGAQTIRAAVQTAVLSLVLLDAALGAAFAGWLAGLAILALFPLSRGLARLFPVA